MSSGPFQGDPDDVTTPELGIDIPTSKIAGGAYMLGYGAHELTDANIIALGGFSEDIVAGTGMLLGAVLTPRDARNIDNKIDDGYPNSGTVRGFDGEDVTEAQCVDLDFGPNIYSISLNPQPIACGMVFRLD